MRVFPNGFSGSGTSGTPQADIIVNPISKKPNIHCVSILDASGSMGHISARTSKYYAAIEGINEEINSLKKNEDANYTHSVVVFDDKIVTSYQMRKIADCPVYVGPNMGGTTALYQAVGETIENLLKVTNGVDSVLIKVFTDGGENASRNNWGMMNGGAKRLHDLIEEVKSKNFTVTFVGTQFDVNQAVKNLGISIGNTMSYDGTAKGLGQTIYAANINTVTFAKTLRSSGAGGASVDNFYQQPLEPSIINPLTNKAMKSSGPELTATPDKEVKERKKNIKAQTV